MLRTASKIIYRTGSIGKLRPMSRRELARKMALYAKSCERDDEGD
jgi:hypothetical protein